MASDESQVAGHEDIAARGRCDVLQVDDSEDDIILLRRALRQMGIASYCGADSLKALEDALKAGARAAVYVVDGEFPRFPGGKADILAGEAVKAIRWHDPKAYIILYSGLENGDKLAGQLGVDFQEKGLGVVGPAKYVARIARERRAGK